MFINDLGKGVNKYISNSADDAKICWTVKCHADDKELYKDITKLSELKDELQFW